MAAPPHHARGLLAGLLCIGAALAVLLPLRDELDTPTAALVLVLPGVVAAVIGGRLPALVTAVLAGVTFNLAFLEPYGTLAIDVAEHVVDLSVFVLVALVTGTLVARERERRATAERRTAEAEAARAERQQLEAEAVGLQLAGEHRSALLRAVSHDLRTPLSTIRAVASDLRDGGGDYDEATRDELLDLVIEEAERLDRLVANLLSLSRIEAGALAPDRRVVDLDELLDQCVRRHGRFARGRKVSLDVPLTLPAVDADWTLVDLAVSNLIANGLRHAPEGSRVLVSARRAGDRVDVAVTDRGPGMPAEVRATAFEPFRRGPGSTSSGVGLAIVRAVARAHGGDARIDDADGGGTTVSFSLPVHGG